ncbi:MAG: biotin/lipoyl-containing protein [Candidatus Acidiferrales bacterium]
MNFRLKIEGRARVVEINPTASRIEFSLDGQRVAADVVNVEPNVFSAILGGEAFEVHIEQTARGARILIDGREYLAELDDPRQWRRGAVGVSGAEGRQSILAPMPSKVVRVLVESGSTVEAGQGLLVVEAMKMQNEIKSPKEGKVERINVSDGQTVNAGEVLAIIA